MTARHRLAAVLVCVLLPAACGDSDGADGVTVSDAWARTTPAGTTTGAVYFELDADPPDRLVGASVDRSVAAAAELHTTMVDASTGQATMDEMGSVDVPAEFAPGGNHVMLIDLVEPLVPGREFELTLVLEEAGDQVVTVEVRDEAP